MKTFLILALSLSLVSCGTISRIFQKTSKHEITKSDSTVKSHKDSSGATKITIHEKIDTSITIPKDSSKTTTPLKNLLNGDSVVNDNGTVKTIITYSPVTHDISVKTVVKPHKVVVRQDKVTEVVSNSKVVTDVKSEVKKSDKVNEKSSITTIKKSGGIPWWIYLILFLLLLTGAYFLFRKLKL